MLSLPGQTSFDLSVHCFEPQTDRSAGLTLTRDGQLRSGIRGRGEGVEGDGEGRRKRRRWNDTPSRFGTCVVGTRGSRTGLHGVMFCDSKCKCVECGCLNGVRFG